MGWTKREACRLTGSMLVPLYRVQREVRVSGNRLSMSSNHEDEVLTAIAKGQHVSDSSMLGYSSHAQGLVSNYEQQTVVGSTRGSGGWRSSVREDAGYEDRRPPPGQDYI